MTAPAATLTYRAPGTGRDARIVAALVQDHLTLVRRIAWHVHGRVAATGTVEVEDLVQTGMVALVEAAQAYEDRGHAFATYAGTRIRGAMIDDLRRRSLMARSAIERRRMLASVRARLTTEQGSPPDAAAMAAAMEMTPDAFRVFADSAEDIVQTSLDESYSDQSMWFADQAEAADDALARQQMHKHLADSIRSLPEREGQVLQLYFVEELNLDEIGAVLGVGAARVCQIKKAALNRLRGMMAPLDAA